MPIEILKNTKSKREAKLTCHNCGDSVIVEFSSPAAPLLTACEAAHEKHKWGFQFGFHSMLTGEHFPLCYKCAWPNKEKLNNKGGVSENRNRNI